MKIFFHSLILCLASISLHAQIIPPVASSNQTFCIGDTVGQLQATVAAKDTLVWYSSNSGGLRIPFSTPLANGKYYGAARGWYDTLRTSTLAGRPYYFSPSHKDSAQISRPTKTAADRFGNVYFIEDNKHNIRKISANGQNSIFAGSSRHDHNGSTEAGDVNGIGGEARFNNLQGITVDKYGNVFVSDFGNNKIKKITPEGVVTTYAGSWGGYTDAPALEANLNGPAGLSMGADGTLYFIDHNNHAVRKVLPNGGDVVTIAGGRWAYEWAPNQFNPLSGFRNGTGSEALFNTPRDIAIDKDGNLYVSDQYNNGKIRKITPAGVVTTYAGSERSYADGTHEMSRFNINHGIVADTLGNVYVADEGNHAIRKILPDSSVITLAGGNGEGWRDGEGSVAQFRNPVALALDTAGNIYVTEYWGHKIRKVSPAGTVTTLAGVREVTNYSGFMDGSASTALFQNPHGITVSPDGKNIFIADSYNHRIRHLKISPSDTVVSTIAGDGNADFLDSPVASSSRFNVPTDLVLIDTNLFVVDAGNSRIRQIIFSPTDTSVVTLAGTGNFGHINGGKSTAEFYSLNRITKDANDDLFVSQLDNHYIRKISFVAPDSVYVSTINPYGEIWYPTGIAFNPSGHLLVSERNIHRVSKYNFALDTLGTVYAGREHTDYLDGNAISSVFNQPMGLAVDSLNNLYVSDFYNHRIRKISPTGVVSTLLGNEGAFMDGDSLTARFYHPFGLSIDTLGNLLVGDYNNHRIRKVNTGTTDVTTYSGGTPQYLDGKPETALFNFPRNNAVDKDGNVYVADEFNHTIRKVTPDGHVSTIAGNGIAGNNYNNTVPWNEAMFYHPKAVAIDLDGSILVADGNNQMIRRISFSPTDTLVSVVAGGNHTGYLVDGNALDAHFNMPHGVAVDSAGNIFVVEHHNHVIRKISTAGIVSTFAGKKNHSYGDYYQGQAGFADGSAENAQFNYPTDIAIDKDGNLYVADHSNLRVRKVSPTGEVSTILGNIGGTLMDGPPQVARFYQPQDGAYDSNGNLFIADRHNHRIRKMSPEGVVTTFAGNGESNFANGLGTEAKFNQPSGLVIDGSDNLYVADHANHLIRKITPTGNVSTFAGTLHEWGGPQSGFADSDASAEGELFSYPHSLAISGEYLYVADQHNHRIRKISLSDSITTTIAGNGNGGNSGDGGNALNAEFNYPTGIAVSPSGVVYFGQYYNNIIRKIEGGNIYAVTGNDNWWLSPHIDGSLSEARFSQIQQIGVLGDSVLIVADAGNKVIRKVDLINDNVSTLAGVPYATGSTDGAKDIATFVYPTSAIPDADGNLIVFDRDLNKIRKVTFTVTGDTLVSTIAGSTHDNFQNVPAPYATLDSQPTAITVDTSGNVYVTLEYTNKIIKIRPDSTYSLLNDYYDGNYVDGNKTEVRFNRPTGISVDATGNLYIADAVNNKIRKMVQQMLFESERTEVDVTVYDYTLAADSVASPTTCGGNEGFIRFTTNLPDGTHEIHYKFNAEDSTKSVVVGSGILTLNGLSKGEYKHFSITANGCTTVDSSTNVLNDPPLPVISITGSTNPSTCDGNEGNISFGVTETTDGTYTLSYKKNEADSTTTVSVTSGSFILSGLAQGIYTAFSFENQNLCVGTKDSTITLLDPMKPVLSVTSVHNPSICEGTDGNIVLGVTETANGSYTLNFKKNGSDSSATLTVTSGVMTLTGLSKGNYSDFRFENEKLCEGKLDSTLALVDPAKPVLSITSASHPTTCNSSDATISFILTNTTDGSYTLQYALNGNNTATSVGVSSGEFTLPGLTKGNYSAFSITNNNQCTSANDTTANLADPPMPVLTITARTHPTTCNGDEGNINFNVTNVLDGTYTFNFKKDDIDSSASVVVTSGNFVLSELKKGEYSDFSFTNVHECTSVIDTTISLTDPPIPVLAIVNSINPTACDGNNGSITFSLSNTANDTYTLNFKKDGNDSTKIITVNTGSFVLPALTEGEYSSFSIINENNCTAFKDSTVTLSDPPLPVLSIISHSNPIICGGLNGEISFTISNTSNDTYTLNYKRQGIDSTAQVTINSGAFTLTGLNSGNYSSFSITNSNACTAAKDTLITLVEPPTPILNIVSSTSPTTCEGTNGSMHFTATETSNGIHTLNYKKDGNDSTSAVTVTSGTFILSSLTAGNYTDFYFMGSNLCEATKDTIITLQDPLPIGLSINAAVNTTSCGSSTGSITFFVSNTTDGSHTFRFKKNDADSTATVSVTSGSFVLSGLTQGVYTAFSFENQNLCVATKDSTITLTDPLKPVLSVTSVHNPSVCNGNDGNIVWGVTETTNGSYTLNFKKNGSDSSATLTVASGVMTLTGLSKGNYSDFRFENQNNCEANKDSIITLQDPLSPILNLATVSNPTSCGGNNGSITFTVTQFTDGVHSLNFRKNSADTSASVTISVGEFTLGGLNQGEYSRFLIENLNHCSVLKDSSVNLTNPDAPILTIGTVSHATSCTIKDGSIAFTASNITDGNYTLMYKKDNADSTKSINVTSGAFVLSGLGNGIYSYFSIINSVNCIGVNNTSVNIENPALPVIAKNSVFHPSTCNATDGSITFSVSNTNNGSFTLQFKKNSTDSSANVTVSAGQFTLSGLKQGNYSDFKLVNQNNCTGLLETSIILNEPLTPTISAGAISDPTSCGIDTGSINFTTNLEAGIYSLKFKKNDVDSIASVTVSSGSFALGNLPKGSYSDFSITTNGCIGRDNSTIVISEPATPTLAAGTGSNPTTCSTADGSIGFTTNLPNGTYTLSYSKNDVPTSSSVTVSGGSFVLSGLTLGQYNHFSITPPNNCRVNINVSRTLTCPCPSSGAVLLASPMDDYDSGVHIKQASITNGKINATNKVSGTAKVNYEAASIELLPGFEAEKGTVFRAVVGGCN